MQTKNGTIFSAAIDALKADLVMLTMQREMVVRDCRQLAEDLKRYRLREETLDSEILHFETLIKSLEIHVMMEEQKVAAQK